MTESVINHNRGVEAQVAMKPFLMTEQKKERYTRQGFWGLPTLNDIFEKNAALHPDKEIFVDSATRVTFSEAKKYVDRLALGLVALGLKKDEVLVLQLPNVVEAALLRLAANGAGVLALPIMIAFNSNEVRHILGQSDARAIAIPRRLGDRDYFQMLQEMRSDLPNLEHVLVIGDDVPPGCISVKEMMQHPIENDFPSDFLKGKNIDPWEVQELGTSSGSTGLPKISENYGWHQLVGHALIKAWKLTQDDKVGLPVPFMGGIANNAWTSIICRPCTLAFLEKFSPTDALKFIEKEKITVFLGVPAIGEMLVRAENLDRYDLRSLRIYFASGAPMPPSLADEVEAKLGCTVVGLLGNTDFGPISCASVDDSVEKRRSSVGKLFPGNEVRIVDENGNDVPPGGKGELLCRGPYSQTGYYKMPEATLDVYGGDMDGWFRSGDLAQLDEEGYLHIVGRLKDQIKRGAMAISPPEIEDLLRTHPKVREVAVVGMPDPIFGEKVCAFVIPSSGALLSFEEMVAFLREKKLATFKLPERLEIIDKFPAVAGQKISKKALTEMVTAKLKQEGKI